MAEDIADLPKRLEDHFLTVSTSENLFFRNTLAKCKAQDYLGGEPFRRSRKGWLFRWPTIPLLRCAAQKAATRLD